MSRLACSLLALTVACGVMVLLSPTGAGSWITVAKAATGVLGLLSLIALLIGRRIKFDPVLR